VFTAGSGLQGRPGSAARATSEPLALCHPPLLASWRGLPVGRLPRRRCSISLCERNASSDRILQPWRGDPACERRRVFV